jgi:release factor glutamine methyltransferase
MNIGSAVKEVTAELTSRNVAEPVREGSLLVCLSIRKDKAFLIAHPEYELTADEKSLLADYVRRRANREPYQYISGRQEFYNLEFEVTPAVLIPRPETEILVERAILSLSKRETPSLCEVGVGSGCISVSILYNNKNAHAVAVDISDRALEVAGRNAAKHQVTDRVHLFNSDVYSAVEQRDFDLIVSNPPYIPALDFKSLQPEVRDFEPYSSLSDGQNGLSIIEKIIFGAPHLLKPDGEILIEIGFDQSTRVEKMFDTKQWARVDLLPDLQGIPRIVHATHRSISRKH